MKFFKLIVLTALFGCGGNDDDQEVVDYGDLDFREEMRQFVIGISEYAKSEHSGFVIIPQNGIELVTEDGEEDGVLHSAYLAAIDGNGQEDLFYGYDQDDKATSTADTEYLTGLLDVSLAAGNAILVTNYCSTVSKVDDSYSKSDAADYVSFAADERELFSIPTYPSPIHNENDGVITLLSDAQNFLYLINPEDFASKQGLIDAVIATNYDLIIMDLFFSDEIAFTAAEIQSLKAKNNGGERMVVSYMSIGEAEDYRYYWESSWSADPPSWIEKENPDWEGNYKVRYWDEDWQAIIYGSEEAYLDRILAAGFDGVYLDIIDAFEYFE